MRARNRRWSRWIAWQIVLCLLVGGTAGAAVLPHRATVQRAVPMAAEADPALGAAAMPAWIPAPPFERAASLPRIDRCRRAGAWRERPVAILVAHRTLPRPAADDAVPPY